MIPRLVPKMLPGDGFCDVQQQEELGILVVGSSSCVIVLVHVMVLACDIVLGCYPGLGCKPVFWC